MTKRILSLIMALLLIPGLLSGCKAANPATGTASSAEYISVAGTSDNEYKTTQSYLGDFTVSFENNTHLTSLRWQEMYWPYSGDSYVNIPVTEGQFVEAGTVLAEIAPNVSESQLLQRQMSVTEGYSAIAEMDTAYNSASSQLQASMSVLSGIDYDIAQKELDAVTAEYGERRTRAVLGLLSSQSALDDLKKHSETTTLVAPYDCYIVDVIWGWREGETVPTWQPIITIADASTIAIKVTNTSPYGHMPYLGQVTITNQANQKTFTGTVVSCADVTGSSSDELVIIPDDFSQLAGITYATSLKVRGNILDKENVVLVNSAAVYTEGDSYYVLILAGGTAVQKTYVSVGGINNGVAWITEGLEAGETLVLS